VIHSAIPFTFWPSSRDLAKFESEFSFSLFALPVSPVFLFFFRKGSFTVPIRR
jgi:hypothetical protein